MKMNGPIILVALVCTIGVLSMKHVKGDLRSDMDSLRSDDITTREAAARSILSREWAQATPLQRRKIVTEIEKIVKEFVNNPDRKGTAKTSIVLLGKLRSEHSIPILLENLTLEVFYKEAKRPQTVEDRFPSVSALIEIGSAAVEPVLAKVEGSDNETVTLCAATILEKVMGKEKAVNYVNQRVKLRTNATQQQRLIRLSQRLGQH
jgi:hypothetical protein